MSEYMVIVVYRTYEKPDCEEYLEKYVAEQLSRELGIQAEKVMAINIDRKELS